MVAACALLLALAVAGISALLAQIEGDRGIPPLATSADIQVNGIEVNVHADSAEEARKLGWREAQRKAWGRLNGPKMPDAQLDAMVVAVVIEQEQIGPRRYIARLGVIFDRARAGQYVATEGGAANMRSAPLLVIPNLYSGGVRQVFEVRGLWQRAWANFQSAASPIQYVRPTGAGGDSLIVTAGQAGRRSRLWWRTVLDQFQAADVLIPVARLERQWPGGPVRGTFIARYGPDNKFLESFTLTANNEKGVPDMLHTALLRMDLIYRDALAQGLLTPDPSLMAGEWQIDAALAELAAKLRAADEAARQRTKGDDAGAAKGLEALATAAPVQVVSSLVVQFATPDAAAVDAALGAVRGAPGVRGAATSSIAIGGTSVMRVTLAGDINALAAALRAQGWQVSVGAGALRISR
ncbi:MAG: heavy-metal-associated domain-containing protein [Alphaproteobacteria bacterium]|nr:heavy-metal-associated domain-containing protein [Alphaproteobacteria bacterium]